MSGEQAAPYDIIFAGGGAAACVTAGRLAAADRNLKILILETGAHIRDVPEHTQPGRYFSSLAKRGDAFTFHAGKPSTALLGRSCVVPMGRALGGGSSVNFTVYTRGSASDYDDWETVHGNKGWGSSSLIPLLKKAETYQAEVQNNTHGSSGPIKVSFSNENINIAEDFLETAAAYDKERTVVDDDNAFTSCDTYSRWARYVDAESGRRSDVAHHYIYNQDHNKNLTILPRQRVVRVVFEGNRAVGVEYVDDVVGRKKEKTEPVVARASRLVVVSAGAFGTPAILERSGIGSKEVLDKNNIPLLVDLPGVGEHYLDHNVIFLPFIASDDSETMDVVFRGTEEEVKPFEQQWLQNGKGLLSQNGLDAGVKMRPNEEERKAMSPEFDDRWKTYFANAPDKPVEIILLFTAYGGPNPSVPRGKYFSMAYFSGYPSSTGNVHITSGLDPYGTLDFHPGYLDDPADVVILRWIYKKSRELARRMKHYRGDLVVGHPEFPAGSSAAATTSGPVEISQPNIVYTKEDDEAIDKYHRQYVETSWHSMGTCAMKPRAQGGVVDERLNVYGVQNLKVADCSIAPANVGANTYNTAIAIGEKAAVIIAEDLGMQGVTAA